MTWEQVIVRWGGDVEIFEPKEKDPKEGVW